MSRTTVFLALGTGACLFGLLALWPRLRTGQEAAPRLAVVERRDFELTLRLQGVVEAARAQAILAPSLSGTQGGTLTLTRLVPAGSAVETGGVLAEFDRNALAKSLVGRETEIEDRDATILAKSAERDAAAARDERELAQAQHAVERAQLDMRRNEILSRIDAEKNGLALEEAKAHLTLAQTTIRLKAEALGAEIRALEIDRDRAKRALVRARRDLDGLSVRSPLAGVLVQGTIWKAGGMGRVEEGDSIGPGVPFLQVVDLMTLQVRARANQVDVGRLRVGQRAAVRLDAYPDARMAGALLQVGEIASAGRYSDTLRTFSVLCSIDGKDRRLMPGLSASIDVELARVPNALVAPRDAVFWDGQTAYVRVKQGQGFSMRPVTVGAASDHEIVVDGIQAGAVLARGAGSLAKGSANPGGAAQAGSSLRPRADQLTEP